MITDADVKKLAKVFATKDDLKNFATKDDLKNFATKDDLKNFATKDDIKRLEEKVDNLKTRIDTFEDNVTRDIATLQNENAITSSYNQRLNIIEAKLAMAS